MIASAIRAASGISCCRLIGSTAVRTLHGGHAKLGRIHGLIVHQFLLSRQNLIPDGIRIPAVFSLIFVSIGNAVSPYVSQNLGAGKTERIKKGYHAALVLDVCFAAVAFLVIETLHTQISALFLGKDGTALAYQVSGDYMRWLGYFFIFMGIKMATDGVLRGLGIMQPFLIANMVNLAIRLSVALIGAPRFGIDFVWLAVPAGWLANFLVSYAALRKSWPAEKVEPSR